MRNVYGAANGNVKRGLHGFGVRHSILAIALLGATVVPALV
jgi:hypothetical protein